MKLELLKETHPGKDDWYSIHMDGKYVIGSYHKDQMEIVYDNLKINPDYLNPRKEILKSDEINVPLEKTI